jgi:hypothetical protein
MSYTEWNEFVNCSVGSFHDATAQSEDEKEWVRLNELARKEIEKKFDDELASNIAVGVHTGLRKGTEEMSAMTIWHAISNSEDSAWSDAAKYCVWGLRQMGYKITIEE